MQSEQLDALIEQWLTRQPLHTGGSYHIQVKLPSDEVEVARLTEIIIAGWVVINWQHRGRGLSAKRAVTATQQPEIAQLLDGVPNDLLHAHFQLILAPDADWTESYRNDLLTPDPLPVLDAGHAIVLSVTAERAYGDWSVTLAHQPPSDDPIPEFMVTS